MYSGTPERPTCLKRQEAVGTVVVGKASTQRRGRRHHLPEGGS